MNRRLPDDNGLMAAHMAAATPDLTPRQRTTAAILAYIAGSSTEVFTLGIGGVADRAVAEAREAA